MKADAFDIYQTSDGYVAVANETRRQILRELAAGDLELPGLVEITGKAKPTLSSVHMRDLQAKRLIEANKHPTDSRRKVYHLIAQKVGSSDLPLGHLREAVKDYVTTSPLAARYPIAMFIDALVAAPERIDPQSLHAQARRLGTLAGKTLQARDGSSFIMAVAALLEQEGLARPLRLNLEAHALDLRFGAGLPADADPERLAHILGGLVEGMGQTRGWIDGPVEVATQGHARQCRLQWV